MASEQRTPDILISGAGMTGLALALALSEQGFEIELVDPQPPVTDLEERIAAKLADSFDSRVSALTRGSEQLLRNLEVWDQIVAWRAQPYSGMHVWDAETRGSISFDSREVHQPCLGHIVENQWIVFALLQKAMADPSIRLTLGTRIVRVDQPEDNRRRVLLSDETERNCALLVGADGARSPTRKLVGLPAHEWDYGHDAVVATLKLDQPHQNSCWQSFTAEGPLALLPLSDPQAVSLVWSTPPEHAQALLGMDEPTFCEAISQQVRARVAEVADVEGVNRSGLDNVTPSGTSIRRLL